MLSTFTVTDTLDDTNVGSLRYAIGEVNSDPNPGVDTIDFAIPGTGPFTINTNQQLPPLLHPVVIDGYSQPGSSVNTLTNGDNAVLMIDLDGTYSYSPSYALDVEANGCTVQGLAITDYFAGIVPDYATSGVLIQGNFIGTDVTGTFAMGNTDGVLFQGSNNDTIGGTTPAAANVISGNTSDAVVMSNQTGNTSYNDSANLIEGNYIGVTASDTSTLANGNDGVDINSTGGNIIGGTAAGAGNVISGQVQYGIQIYASNDNLVQGNDIGTDRTGTIPLGNQGPGVLIENASLANSIGGTAAGAGNAIAFNSGAGVKVGYYSEDGSDGNDIVSNSIYDNSGAGVVVGDYSSDTTVGDAILSNSIYGNGALGIDLGDDYITPNTPGGPHSGPNDLQNFPVLANAATFNGSTYINGTLNSAPSATFTLQFFSNDSPDPTGYGQGQILIGTTTLSTDASGNASFSESIPFALPTGEYVSATATDSSGDTSEFGQDVSVFAATGLVVAANDSYGVFENSPITVPAPGVLGNDYDLTGKPLTAVLVQSTSHGTLSFQSDGALTYTPKANFVGADTFTYYDTDGTNKSNVATVTLNEYPLSLIVTNTNDSGPGSLRQALLVADLSTSSTPDTIRFKIPGTGPFTIQLLTPLPTITHPTVINGYNEAGAEPNSLAQGDNAVILIGIVGNGGGDGLSISAGGSTVEGLAFERFQNGIHLTSVGGNVITGNFIGTGPSGTGNTGGNGTGILVEDTGSDRIGGNNPANRNIISANSYQGILIDNGSTGNRVQGNWIGLDVTGENRLGNYDGVVLTNAPGTTIGGTADGAGNVISGNAVTGIVLGASGDLIQGNLIGTDVSGTMPLANNDDGVTVSGPNNTIGGTTSTSGNVIAYNANTGVGVVNNATGVGILTNSIFGNSDLGIDLGDNGVTLNTPGGHTGGPNNLQNFPVLLAAMTYNGRTYIKGTFNSGANGVFTIQFYANSTADPSGYGQGQIYLGQAKVKTDSTGNANFQVSFPTVAAGDQYVSATATDQSDDTSEFAADIPVLASAQSVYAVGDQYDVNFNTSLNVAAPGVLINDIAANGKSFKSLVVTGPAYGTLKLKADGSFVYVPEKGFTGIDSFTYDDVQGSTTSNVATVTIDVQLQAVIVASTGGSSAASRPYAMLNPNLTSSLITPVTDRSTAEKVAPATSASRVNQAALEAVAQELIFIHQRRRITQEAVQTQSRSLWL